MLQKYRFHLVKASPDSLYSCKDSYYYYYCKAMPKKGFWEVLRSNVEENVGRVHHTSFFDRKHVCQVHARTAKELDRKIAELDLLQYLI